MKKRKPVTAATRERRKHQATRDLLWDRLNDVLNNLWSRADRGSGDEKQVEEARALLRVLRKTGAK